jgi:hypothetical protein
MLPKPGNVIQRLLDGPPPRATTSYEAYLSWLLEDVPYEVALLTLERLEAVAKLQGNLTTYRDCRAYKQKHGYVSNPARVRRALERAQQDLEHPYSPEEAKEAARDLQEIIEAS